MITAVWLERQTLCILALQGQNSGGTELAQRESQEDIVVQCPILLQGPAMRNQMANPSRPFSTTPGNGLETRDQKAPATIHVASVGSVVKHSSPGKSRRQSACTIRHQVYAQSLPPPGSEGRPISTKGWKRCHALPPLGKKQRPKPMLQWTPNLCAERPWKRPSWLQPPDCEYQAPRHSQLIRHTCPFDLGATQGWEGRDCS